MELVLLDLATGREVVLTDNDWNDLQPVWSPAGDGVVFLSTHTGEARVFLAPAHGGAPLDLSGFEEYAEAVVVMPRPEPRKAVR